MASSNKRLVSILDYEEHARTVLPNSIWVYYSGGANDGYTVKENRGAFERLRIRPRVLRDISQTSTATTALGTPMSMPVGVAPTAMQKMAHPDGEVANARACGAAGCVFILSTVSTSSLEDVATGAPDTVKWFQLFIYKDRAVTQRLVERVERAGYRALVLTVDVPTRGQRNTAIKSNFQLPPHLSIPDFWDEKTTKMDTASSGSGVGNYVNTLIDPSLTWDDVKWLKSVTRLPIVLKGILTAEDAVIGADLGVAAIQVSNHGGRQIDGVPASIEALSEIVRAVGHRVEVYLDGGVTKGTDVFKALALGARMVFVGRPALWGLAQGGQDGVQRVLGVFKSEFTTAMTLSGCASVSDVSKEMVVHESFYHKL